jgi:alkylated DNA repair protein (DNA oxidative demethylase)
MTPDLFSNDNDRATLALGANAFALPDFALPHIPDLLSSLAAIESVAPFRQMHVPGGATMSVAMTNTGSLGWTSDRRGYRYTPTDPDSGLPWPAMPAAFERLAREAAAAAGFPDFAPDACLINRYSPGSRLSLHQDREERDLQWPVVSVSLGMDATFLFGGHKRTDRTVRVPLRHGDVVVWGGEDRLRFHGVLPLKGAPHPLLGEQRINLTFRKAG